MRKVTIKIRRDTEKRWIEYNPILENGEPAINLDLKENNLKIGDGKRNWNDLPYVSDGVDWREWVFIETKNKYGNSRFILDKKEETYQ
jgi:hypothetical protein